MMLTTTFGALSDPTRLAVVTQLSRGQATVSELAAPHAMTLPAFVKHLGVLVDAGLVHRRKVGRTVTCSLATERLAEAESWLSNTAAFWNTSLDRLERLLTQENS